MEQDRAFERKYSLNVARLKKGNYQESFEIDHEFFEKVGNSLISEGQIKADLNMVKYTTHLDAKFDLGGTVQLNCDRCGQPYPQAIKADHRIIYSFSPSMKFEGLEVIYVDPDEPNLSLVQELYDFISLSLPMRRVPPPEIHICPPEVLHLLGLDASGEPLPEGEEDEGEENAELIDERWAALKKLKDQMEKEN